MGLSGFLYVAIVVGWAVYLVPFALKRHDEATRNRSIDRFSSAMRVLGHRDGDVAGSETSEATEAEPSRSAVSAQAPRIAAKVAARRRRRVFLMLVFATAVTAGAAGVSVIPWWSVAIPGGLVVIWLMACRTQARRERGARAADPGHAAQETQAEAKESRLPTGTTGPGASVDPALLENAVPDSVALPEVAPDDEPTVVLRREALDAAGAQHSGQGSLWDPVPVTLPTYVHKPRAPRTIRTIDLGPPGVQTAGRSDEASSPAPAQQPHEPAQSQRVDEPVENTGPTRRAVGE